MHETNAHMAATRGSLREAEGGREPGHPTTFVVQLGPGRWRDGAQGEVGRGALAFLLAEAVIVSWSGAKRKWPTIS